MESPPPTPTCAPRRRRTTVPGVPRGAPARSLNPRPPAKAHGSCSPSPGAPPAGRVHRAPAPLPGSLRGRRRPRCLRTRRVPLGAGRGERGRCFCRGAEPEQRATPPPARPGRSAAARTGHGGRGAGSRPGSRPSAPVMPRGDAHSSFAAAVMPGAERKATVLRPGPGGFSPALDGRGGAKRRRSEPGMECPSVQDEDASKKPPSLDRASKKWQQLLTDLEGLFRHMEVMFSLTRVPRVLFLLGGTVMSPREFYELNLESICEGSAEESLEPASCVRKLFRSLFVADVFSELEDLPVVGTVVMLQGHRSCGNDWFRPKLNYKVPTRGRKLTVNLSCDEGIDISASPHQPLASTREDYVWFQAPVTLKGFRE
ncbi:serine/arginine repetitive matrix protein 3-like isoform X2 [Cuculus canorus]|uniref:serine/arginine repetitive matrix protein 3-like isoform X2 n=1 Tax=Cuculus canorus TaxID=55661 RepID=UPI0023AAAAC7|nr:serine/arginine repetitive matrix protein 3-like isoform X2 [Cuculus canorus]